jgi:hypothetical protein
MPCYTLFATDPALERIRRDPGYRALMERLRADWERRRRTL